MGNNSEVTIKIKAEADPSLSQVSAKVKQELEKTVQEAKSIPQDLNQQFTTALLQIEAQSRKSSDAIVAELRQITGSIAQFSTQVAQGHAALANSLNQIVGAGSGAEKVTDQIKEGTSEALQAAEGMRLLTETTVRFISESVTHGVELVKELDEVRDRLENITHSSIKTQEIMQTVNATSLDIGSFDLKGLRTASAQLALFHQDVGKHLTEAADLASYAGKSIEQTATTFGRAMEGQKKAFNNLMTQFDIGPGDLARFGAELDKNGKLALDTSAHIDKARNALEKWIQTYAEGASKPGSLEGNIQAAKNAFQLLQEEMAKPMLPVLQTLTLTIRDVSKYFISLPDGIKSATAELATLGGGMAMAAAAFIVFAGPINQVILLCGTLAQTIPALATLMTRLGTVIAGVAGPVTILVMAAAAMGFAIENWKRKEEELADAMQKKSNEMAKVKKEWEQYVKLVNEAGQGKGPDLSPSNAPPSQKINEINKKLQTVAPSDVSEALKREGISEEQLKKEDETNKERKKNVAAELELLRKAKKNKTPSAVDADITEEREYLPSENNDIADLSDLTTAEREQWKELTKDAKSYDDILQKIKEKQVELSKYTQSSKITGGILSKTESASSAAERVKDLTESTDVAIKYSEKFKNPEGEKGNMAGDIQRLELLKSTQKKIAAEIKSTFDMEVINTDTVLKKLESVHDVRLRGMLETYLKYGNGVEDTQKSIIQGEIKNFEDSVTAKRQRITSEMELDKMSQDQKLAAEKKTLKELNDISRPSGAPQKYEVNGVKYSFGGTYSGIGPETELQHQQKLYQTNKDYREKVEKEKAEAEKSILSDTKKSESDHLKDLEVENENYLSSRRETTKSDFQAQIADLNLIAAKYQENADRRVISEEAAAKKIADINKKMADLEVKSDEQRFNSQIKLSQEHQKTSSIRLQHLEKELQAGKDVQGAIISEVKKRLDYEMQMIDLKAQKDLENSEHTIAAQEAIFWGAQNAKHDALEKEKSYIDSIIKKEENSLNSIEARTKQFGGFQSLNAFGEGKSLDEIPSISGFSSQIDINAKTKSQTQLQSYSDQLKSQINSMGLLDTSLTTLNTSVNNLTQVIVGGSPSAGESKNLADMMTESPMKAAGWSKSGFDAGALDDIASMFGQLVVKGGAQTSNVQQVFNIGGRSVPLSAEMKQITQSMVAACGKMISNNGILKTMGAGWGFDTFSQGGWGFNPVSKEE